MPAVAVQSQDLFTNQGQNFCITWFIYNATGETVLVPVGSVAGAVIASNSSDTAPSLSLAQGTGNDTGTLTSGTVGKKYCLVTRHTGGPGSAR